MGIITVSRTHGSGGTIFAKKLALKLNYEFVDSSLIRKFCEIKEGHVCAFGLEDEHSPTFFDKIQQLMSNRSFYKIALMANIYERALKNDAIFIGMGTGIILSEIPNVLNIRIIRILSERVKSIAAAKDISYDEALEQIHKMDAGKREFVSQYFDKNLDDPILYDLIINSSSIPLEDAIDMMYNFSKRYFTENGSVAAKSALKNRLLEKRAEILLFRLNMVHDYGKVIFDVKEEGILTVKGVIGGEHQKKQLLDTLKGLEEVKKIEDQVKVEILSHIIY